MRICVFGAGAVGGHLAARLAASGHEVSVVLRAALEKSGMSSPAPEDIRQSVWAKLVQNIGNSSLCLLAESWISQVAADPELGELNRRAKAEAAAIASALGVDIARAPLAMARAAGVPTPTLDVLIPLAARKAAAKGLYKP